MKDKTITTRKTRLASGIYRGVLLEAPRNGKLTAAYLEKHGACPFQLARFENEWPNGMKLTRENIVKCGKSRFPMQWVQYTLLTDSATVATRTAFHKAKERMNDQCRKLQDKYNYKEISWDELNKRTLAAETRLRVKQATILADALGL